jgi:hypothetical protein
MALKTFFSTLLAGVATVLIFCIIVPSGYAVDFNSPKKDGELSFPTDYRSWEKFLPTVERADKEEIREIYINDRGTKGTEVDGFPHGTTFLMEIFMAKRGSLILMPNETLLENNTGGWEVEIYVTPSSLLLPTDTPGRCRWLSADCGWNFMVKDRAVDTGIHVPKGATVRVVSGGVIRFEPRSTPIDADGAAGDTTATYPAPALRKYSLICKVGDSEWVQCGTNMTFTPEGTDTLLRASKGRLVKGKLKGIYLMQKGKNWGKETAYETGDWVFDHYRPLTGQLCAEEDGTPPNGSLRCFTGLHISRQHEKAPHENWSRDCRRCHIPAFEEAGSHDRDFVYGYDQHFKMNKASTTQRRYSAATK